MNEDYHDATLDPPGSIAVLGTTPLGIEAALYGRFLGYDVQLLAGLDHWLTPSCARENCCRIGPTFNDDWFANHWLKDHPVAEMYEEALPMMPDRCLSSLARSAITAQDKDALRVLPSSMRQWIEDGLWQITQTDLLRGRTFTDTFVKSIELVPVVDSDNSDEDQRDGEVPPDFRLHLSGAPIESEQTFYDCECVIVAGLPIQELKLTFELPNEYLFVLSENATQPTVKAAEFLRSGYQQITEVFARLAGRPELDLYRPVRL